jgi:hypothetical protein
LRSSGERAFQVEGTANTKALSKKNMYTQRTERPVPLQENEEG